MIEYNALPKNYNGCYVVIAEEEATRIWAEVCELQPSREIIEGISLKVNGKKTLHEGSMSIILKHNMRYGAVFDAESYIEATQSFETDEEPWRHGGSTDGSGIGSKPWFVCDSARARSSWSSGPGGAVWHSERELQAGPFWPLPHADAAQLPRRP